MITLTSSLKYAKKIASENAEICRSRQPHCRLMPSPRGTSVNNCIYLIPPETRVTHWPIVWVHLHSNFCGGLRKRHLFSNRVHIGRSRSSKVVDFGTNWKGVCDFLLVINSNLAPFLRYGDLLAENCEFFLPHSHSTPSLGMNPFEFVDEFFIPKTRFLGLSAGEDFVILACIVFTQCQRVTDGQTTRS